MYEDWPDAAATALVVDDPVLDPPSSSEQFVDDPMASRARYASSPELVLTIAAVERAFGKPIDRLVPGDSGDATLDLVIDIRPTAFPARNVVAILRGRDATVANEYIALGAHSDHVGCREAGGRPRLASHLQSHRSTARNRGCAH